MFFPFPPFITPFYQQWRPLYTTLRSSWKASGSKNRRYLGSGTTHAKRWVNKDIREMKRASEKSMRKVYRLRFDPAHPIHEQANEERAA